LTLLGWNLFVQDWNASLFLYICYAPLSLVLNSPS
jgi:hypothetical protein